MKNYVIMYIILMSMCNIIWAMEKNNRSDQKMLAVHCGNQVCMLEEWKASQSIPLYTYYLKNNSLVNLDVDGNKIITLPSTVHVTYASLSLFSKALDNCDSNDMFKKFFYETLSPKEQEDLIIVVGKFDKGAIKQDDKKYITQLYSPILISKIIDIDNRFNEDIRNYISQASCIPWREYCYAQVMINNKENMSLFKWFSKIENSFFCENKAGSILVVPESLKNESVIFNDQLQPAVLREEMLDGVKNVCCIKRVGGWKNYLTFVDDSSIENQIVFCSENSEKNIKKQIIIRHEGVTQECYFSEDGKSCFIASDNNVCLTTIAGDVDNPIFKTTIIDENELIMAADFNSNSNVLAVCSVDDPNKFLGRVKLFDTAGNCIINSVVKGRPYRIKINEAGNRIMVFYELPDLKFQGILYQVPKDNAQGAELISEPVCIFDFIKHIVCSKDGNHWAVLSHNGNLTLVSSVNTGSTSHQMFQLLKSDQPESEGNETKIVFSADNEYLVGLVPDKNNRYSLCAWFTKIDRKVTIWNLPYFAQHNYNFAITADNSMLTIFSRNKVLGENADNFFVKRVPFLSGDDYKKLKNIPVIELLYTLSVLNRLCRAHVLGDRVKLYQEEPAYKVLYTPIIDNVFIKDAIEKLLPFKVIDNKKDIRDAVKQTINSVNHYIKNLSVSAVNSFNKLW